MAHASLSLALLGARATHALGPGQIHEVEAPGEFRPGGGVFAGDVQHEDGARSRRDGVHLRRLDGASRRGASNQPRRRLHRLHRLALHAGNLRDALWGVHDAVLVAVSASSLEQVAHLLVVNLGRSWRASRTSNPSSRSPWTPPQPWPPRGDDAPRLGIRLFAEHRVRLAGARLSVREEAHLVPVQRGLDELRHLLKHLRLRGLGPKDAIKLETGSFGIPRIASDGDAASIRGALHARRVAGGGSHAAEHANVAAEFLNLVVQRAARGVGVQRLLLELLDAREAILGEFLERLHIRRHAFRSLRGFGRLDQTRGERGGVLRGHIRLFHRVFNLLVEFLAVVADARWRHEAP